MFLFHTLPPLSELMVLNNCFFLRFAIISGECWSGPEAGETYNRNGAGTACVTSGYKNCTLENNMECIGGKETNFVYRAKSESE